MDKQELAISIGKEGGNLLLTGEAGTGKTYTTKKIITGNSVVTASTGIAALNVGGLTAHSVFGLPVGVVTEDDLNRRSPEFYTLFNNPVVTQIVIDEVTMLRIDYLELIDYKLRKIKEVNKPFGGLQIILVGDLFQLGPIVGSTEKTIFKRKYLSPWFFTSKVFKEAEFNVVELDKVYRQENIEQVNALNAIRSMKEGWQDAVDQINTWSTDDLGEVELLLCTFNKDADDVNEIEYSKVQGTERIYTGVFTGNYKQKDNPRIPQILKLREGTRVMIAANSNTESEDEYRNGMVGTVVDMEDDGVTVETDTHGEIFVEKQEFDKSGYTTLGGKVKRSSVGTFRQVPLRHAYAISVHKSQGLTLDSVAINFGEKSVSTAALAYVGLSRVRDLTNMRLVRSLRYDDINIDNRVKRFLQRNKL